MSDSSLISDPTVRFVDEQQSDLVDFIFRLTADRSRAAVMAREACRQMKDELQSQMGEDFIRCRLFQLAYELNEEAMRPIAADFFEAWYRYQHDDPKAVAAAYRWELKLRELGQHAAMLLLLRHRYGFTASVCAWILYREEAGAQRELALLEELIQGEKGFDLAYLSQLPRYGFLALPEAQSTTLSAILSQLGVARHRGTRWLLVSILFLILGWVAYTSGILRQLPSFLEVWPRSF